MYNRIGQDTYYVTFKAMTVIALIVCNMFAISNVCRANTTETNHFTIEYFGDQNSAYSRIAGNYLESAYSRYLNDFLFSQSGRSSATGKYEIYLRTFIPPGAQGQTLMKLGQTDGETIMRLVYNLDPVEKLDLNKTCYHEYFHAVTNTYLPYAKLWSGYKDNAAAQIWCIEGLARLMEYLGPYYPDYPFQAAVPMGQEAGWLKGSEKSLRTRNHGYDAFLYWYFISCNQHVPFDKNLIHTSIITNFWKELSKEKDWDAGNEQTEKVMDAALTNSPSTANTFKKSFLEFTRAIAFPDEYFPPGENTTLWINNNRHVIPVTLTDGSMSLSGDNTKTEEMGARYYKVSNMPSNQQLTISLTKGAENGYRLSVYAGGSFNAMINDSVAAPNTYVITTGQENNTIVILTRLPGSTGADDCTLNFTVSETPPVGEGMLDIVLCIDRSGSMMDDIRMVQSSVDTILKQLSAYAKSSNISLRVGLITYIRHDESGWITADPLTADVDAIRGYIRGIDITNVSLGAGGNEDTYGALMYGMNQRVGGQQIDMGWRPNAAKIIFAIGDEPQDDPDWEKRTLDAVATVARNLDPVHVYPLLTPKQGSGILDTAVRAKSRLADATGGHVIRVKDAKSLPDTIIAAVKTAVREHRDEVWRKTHPPYLLYGLLLGMVGLVFLSATVALIRTAKRRPARPA